jgi:pimeloyl-ACP methyl ester carboxylesterase
MVASQGTNIELLTWGERGKPGLLLVHGNSAHADWWSFIAPILAEDYRVASMSLAGMGASDWRPVYAFDAFAEDAEACARAAGLYEGGRKPTYIGHSFGGSQVFYAACKFPERMHAAVLVDSGFGGPPSKEQIAEMQKRMGQVRNIPTTDRPARVYPTLQAALARFRFMPPQPVENFYIADFIARRSLKRAPLPDGSGEGWTWRFDPEMWNKLDRTAMNQMMSGQPLAGPTAPLAHIYGDNSAVLQRKKYETWPEIMARIPHVAVPDSHHHVMVDQPLALIAALRGLLATWPA